MLDSTPKMTETPYNTGPATRFATRNLVFAVAVIGLIGLALAALAIVVGVAYHRIAHNSWGPIERHFAGGLLIAICYVTPFMLRGEYTVDSYLRGLHRWRQTFIGWNMAFLTFAFIAFLTKTTAGYSRGAFLTFYGAGLIALLFIETRVRAFVLDGLRSGRIAPRHTMLIGLRDDLAMFQERLQTIVPESERLSMRIVAVTVVPDQLVKGDLAAEDRTKGWDHVLSESAQRARAQLPDDVVVLGSWRFGSDLERCVETFMLMPTAIHLDGGPMFGRFTDVKVRRLGGAATVSLTEPPVKPIDLALKRLFDIVGAAVGQIGRAHV